ncbi:MAG: phosphodiester glycosidase family protein [Clostridia bacterium]|nr:phosphodiester glycosidase family protein [Clostridia bacterium]
MQTKITPPEKRTDNGIDLSNLKPRRPHKSKKQKRIGKIIVRILAFIFTFVFAITLTLYCGLGMLCANRVSKQEKAEGKISEILYITVPTFLETGAFKFIPSLYLSSDSIQAIVDKNKMKDMNADVDEGLINLGGTKLTGRLNIDLTSSNSEQDDSSVDNGPPIEIHEVSDATYFGTMIVVKDPSRVSLATIYPWREIGVTLDRLVEDNGAIGGINGGLYNSYNNTGGSPYGVVVSNGEIQCNQPQSFAGLVLIGFTESNVLQIIDVSKMNAKQVEQMIKEKKIRDAVTFQDEASDANNHFVQLIINGEVREMNGMGSGLNPRTAIGQRADGAVLMFVTDGRGKNGHLGASASDLIKVMKDFGAVNAANLDGGSSSCMYYDGEYLMTSVTFYYTNASWYLPTGFIIK